LGISQAGNSPRRDTPKDLERDESQILLQLD
jgi:hypothetical protein